ncbi:MAG TPA: hypothetical protein VGH90_04680 [Chthoniobacteraceae bacterium]|jgi:hypothetical protein
MAESESALHLDLKRLALAWARTQGFRIAAPEVSAPSLGGCRLDAAAYRPERGKGSGSRERLGATVIFECKQARADFLRDSRSRDQIAERLRKLHERKQTYEESMKLYYPSLRNGDALFPELDSYRFEASGYPPYEKLLAEIALLSRRLHAETKFARLFQWKAANLHYVVAEPGVVKAHELPAGWGLLVQREKSLELQTPAIWQEASDDQRWALLLRIAMSGTRTVHRHLQID